MIQLIVSTRKRVTKHFGSDRFHKHKKMYLMCFFCIAINANISIQRQLFAYCVGSSSNACVKYDSSDCYYSASHARASPAAHRSSSPHFLLLRVYLHTRFPALPSPYTSTATLAIHRFPAFVPSSISSTPARPQLEPGVHDSCLPTCFARRVFKLPSRI
jgi:hypothetical protein